MFVPIALTHGDGIGPELLPAVGGEPTPAEAQER